MSQETPDANIRIGIIAIQGDFEEHLTHFNALKNNVKVHLIKNQNDLFAHNYDALVFPGGESTTHRIVMERNPLFYQKLYEMIVHKKIPTWGTCCGLIILAKKLDGKSAVPSDYGFPCLDVDVIRNVYGSQNYSFCDTVVFEDLHRDEKAFEGIFIRAPAICEIGTGVKIVARLEDKYKYPIVGVKQNNIFASCFHPELTRSTLVHEYFVNFALMHKTK